MGTSMATWACAIAAFAPVVTGLSAPTPPNAGRRAVLLGTAASLAPAWFTAVKPAVANDDNKGNKNAGFTTDRVIVRALREQMLEPRDIRSCDELEDVYKIDVKAADKLRELNDELSKLSAATKETIYERKYQEPLGESYELGRLVERRIRERAQQINVKYVNECGERFEKD
tara:strand:- start:1859 stop:2374 length:516 start_codon:yes stop_codon:yes gene_type:complete